MSKYANKQTNKHQIKQGNKQTDRQTNKHSKEDLQINKSQCNKGKKKLQNINMNENFILQQNDSQTDTYRHIYTQIGKVGQLRICLLEVACGCLR